MAALSDTLFLNRHKQRLFLYWGVDQLGGRYEAVAATMSITLLAQLRMSANLPLFVNFSDEDSGFDTQSHDDIRIACFDAGIRGRAWMLLDDCLRNDTLILVLAYFVSNWVKPQTGIAQGRKRSLADFNSSAKLFNDHIRNYTSGASAPVSALPKSVLDTSQRVAPTSNLIYDFQICESKAPEIKAALDESFSAAAQVLAELDSFANRLVALDLFFGIRIVIVQYVDDNALPASSYTQCSLIWQGNEAYSDLHGPSFNLKPGKSAILVVGESNIHLDETVPKYRNIVVPVVERYKHMGIILDRWFCFEPHLKQCLGSLDAAFRKLLGTVSSISLPWVVAAESVPLRVESVALNGLPFCIGVDGAESCLNRLQAEWAKTLLGFDGFPQGAWPFLICEVGWKYRLGTRMYGAAIMLEARLLLPPTDLSIHALMKVAGLWC